MYNVLQKLTSVLCIVTLTILTPVLTGCHDRTAEEPEITETKAAVTGNTVIRKKVYTVSDDATEGKKTVSFLGAGDAIVHPGIWMEAAKWASQNGTGREYDFSHLFTEVKAEIADADIAFINQETLMAGEEYGYSGYPRFNSPQELGYDLCDTGFDVINIANNHMLDQFTDGLSDTLDFWDTMDCTVIGGYRNTEDFDNIRIVKKNGIRIAFLSYCYGTNGLSLNASSDLVVPYLDDVTVIRQCVMAEERADFTIVSVHWGEENVEQITEEQRHYAQLFADYGADVVLGHHPHVIQPVEWVEGKNGNRMLCAYSLGNFFSLMEGAHNAVGGILRFDLTKEYDIALQTDVFAIENIVFEPTVFYFNSGFFDQKIYRMENFSEALAAKHGISNYGNTMSYAELLTYTRNLIDPDFLPEALREATDTEAVLTEALS